MKHVIIYSHGFGTDPTDRGLFTDIASNIETVEHVMLTYDTKQNNQTIIGPIQQNIAMLRATLTRYNNAGYMIDIIAHSHGCVIAALACTKDFIDTHNIHVNNLLLLTPPLDFDLKQMKNMLEKNYKIQIDINKPVTIQRTDATVTKILPEYWKSLSEINVPDIYTNVTKRMKISSIEAFSDEILPKTITVPTTNTHAFQIPGNHSFDGTHRKLLHDTIKQITDTSDI